MEDQSAIKCLNCGYTRTQKDNDFITKEKCPRCGIYYKKIDKKPASQQRIETTEEKAKDDNNLWGLLFNEHRILAIRVIIVFCIIWVVVVGAWGISLEHNYDLGISRPRLNMAEFILIGILPVSIILGILWILQATRKKYTKNVGGLVNVTSENDRQENIKIQSINNNSEELSNSLHVQPINVLNEETSVTNVEPSWASRTPELNNPPSIISCRKNNRVNLEQTSHNKHTESDLGTTIRNKSTEFLIGILKVERKDYTQEAISIAEDELKKRNIDIEASENLTIAAKAQEALTEENVSKTGPPKRFALYVTAFIVFILIHVILKKYHIGGILVWIPFYLFVTFIFYKIHGMFREIKK